MARDYVSIQGQSTTQTTTAGGKPLAEPIGSTQKSLHTASPSERPGSGTQYIIRDITTTRQSFNFPSGAKALFISYRLLPGATATANQFVKYVLNAPSDAVADGLLAVDNAFDCLFQGDDQTLAFTPTSTVTRIDLVAEQAVGSEKTVIFIKAIL